MKRFFLTVLAVAGLGIGSHAAELPANPQRIVSVGGAVTETIFALGAGDRVVGVDTSSIYPEAATKLPQCGYQRMLAAEGVVSLKPDVVFLAGASGPPTAIEQLEKMNIPLFRLEEGNTLEAVKERTLKIGKALGKEAEAQALVAKIDEQMAALNVPQERPRVLFVLSRGAGSPLISGRGSAADAMIALAGGVNAAGEMEGYKPVSGEALATFNPDVVLTTSRTFAAFGEGGVAKALPGIELTPAGKANRVIVMDDLYLLGFGPRTAEAVAELAERIHAPAKQEGTAKAGK